MDKDIEHRIRHKQVRRALLKAVELTYEGDWWLVIEAIDEARLVSGALYNEHIAICARRSAP